MCVCVCVCVCVCAQVEVETEQMKQELEKKITEMSSDFLTLQNDLVNTTTLTSTCMYCTSLYIELDTVHTCISMRKRQP